MPSEVDAEGRDGKIITVAEARQRSTFNVLSPPGKRPAGLGQWERCERCSYSETQKKF